MHKSFHGDLHRSSTFNVVRERPWNVVLPFAERSKRSDIISGDMAQWVACLTRNRWRPGQRTKMI